ncbi:Metal-dependent hydrolase of the beta-lactamase superfamily II [Halalkaliarchaeum sp. AArc-CO]|uniref:N-acyl homoserine lactonase family protein n=1 Tax=unclassified Halalkaliarchaeum TaxID=2678344 RepID=UPI00217DECCC|nr:MULTISPECIES: N-acyl homoserine lactonase family protein [unclassified Halalkaliarchaeum]MDR5673955.1 N-acyl homoserine lactonase family protein [Halalkaliarchaeum sp. AArc-GB]UWG50591.1 Metal-dependent hydrolase of the beta-lactamase superfamily II [Halalkaliarchaeum sp. AArc-CO]
MELHLLDRGRIHADLNFALDAEVAAIQSDQSPELQYGEFAVWNLLIDHPEATVLWDTGSHPDAGDGHWPAPLFEAFAHVDARERDLETALSEAGYGVGDVDCVVQSHLHLDHAGGLHRFEGTDVPVYVHRRELEHAYLSANTDAGGDAYLAADFDRDLNWQVVHGERQLLPGIDLLDLPGHTPGLLGAEIDREQGTLLIAGDEAFLAENYEEGRSMGSSLVYDSRAWARSRRKLKERERHTDATVLYGHDLDQFERLKGQL